MTRQYPLNNGDIICLLVSQNFKLIPENWTTDLSLKKVNNANIRSFFFFVCVWGGGGGVCGVGEGRVEAVQVTVVSSS